MENDFFNRMCKEALEELASGEKGWRDADTNTLVLACFGILSNHLAHMIVRPLWWFAGSVAAAAVAYVLISIFIRP